MRFGKPKDVSTLLELKTIRTVCVNVSRNVFFLLLLNVSKLVGP